MYKRYALKGIVLVLILLTSSGCGRNLLLLFPEQTIDKPSPVIDERNITQEFKENLVWHRGNLYIRNILMPSPGIITGYGYVAFVDFLGGPLSDINRLELLDSQTGVSLWQSNRFSDHEAFAISKDKAFVLLNEGNPLMIYNLVDSNDSPTDYINAFEAHTQFYLFPTRVEEDFYFYYNWDGKYSLHLLNLKGKEIAKPHNIITVTNSQPNLFLFDQPFMLTISEQKATWVDFETGEELWQIPFSGRLDSWPVLQGNTLFISAGSLRRELIALNIETGQELWRTEKEFGSNVVWHKGSLYTLRNDAVLVKITPKTGEVKQEIPFQPATIDAGSWAYWLVSDGERLIVYFGDSQELFALDL
jgi:outer membrane protein assembly factor BamB